MSLSDATVSRHVVGMARAATQPSIDDVVRDRLRELRRARGLTQEVLSERAGISVDAVNRIEHGSRAPTLGTLAKLATALGVEVVDLVRTSPLPAPRFPAAVERVAAMLADQSDEVQDAAGKIVRVLVGLGRS